MCVPTAVMRRRQKLRDVRSAVIRTIGDLLELMRKFELVRRLELWDVPVAASPLCFTVSCDVNTAELELSELRGRISIIPQEPWLCAGTVRFNVDPPGQFTDKEIWEALDRAHFGAHIRNLPSQLDHNIEEGGKNLSQGQAQLICLARALLVRSTILLLDEATAAVDNQTDALIQQTIRKEFASCTIITIAHRIDTITDSDRIMVMDEGRVVEFDSPSVLLDRPTGHFRKMYDARPSLKE